MHHRLRDLTTRGLTKIRTNLTALQSAAKRLWRAHLTRVATSPVYEAVLVAGVDLLLGHRVDLHQALIRLMTRLGRTRPELPEPDGWAY